jgi:hypothetical protein
MATITDYASLKAQIADYLNRDDLTSQIPMFIQFVEVDLNNQLRMRDQVVRAEATSSAEFVQLPSDWLEAISLKMVSGVSPLRYVTLDQANLIKKEQLYTQVTYYSIMDDAIELVPAPGDDVEIEMVYYKKIPSLSDSVTTNWLLERAPDAYLYGALTHAAPFLMDDQRIPVFAQFYGTRVVAMQNESDVATHSGGPLITRTRQAY